MSDPNAVRYAQMLAAGTVQPLTVKPAPSASHVTQFLSSLSIPAGYEVNFTASGQVDWVAISIRDLGEARTRANLEGLAWNVANGRAVHPLFQKAAAAATLTTADRRPQTAETDVDQQPRIAGSALIIVVLIGAWLLSGRG